MKKVKMYILILLFTMFILLGLTSNKMSDLYYLFSLIVILNLKIRSENKLAQISFWIYFMIFIAMFTNKLFSHGGLTMYSIMVVLYVIANTLVLLSLRNNFKFSKNEMVSFLIYENLGMIFGLKLVAFFYDYELYRTFNFWSVGYASFGAWVGVTLIVLFFSFCFKKPLKNMICAYIPAPLIYAIAKVGCIYAGCCYGIEYSGIGAVKHPHIHDKTFFPVQSIESTIFMVIFIYIIKKVYQNKYNLKVLGIMFINYGFFKFLLDFFRMSHMNQIISLNQVACFFIIIIGCLLIYLYNRNENNLKN